MSSRLRAGRLACLFLLLVSPGLLHASPALEPIAYTVRAPAPESHIAEIEASFPTGRKPSIELMMAVWSPGFYRIENYADKVEDLVARTPGGDPLQVEKTRGNRWTVSTNGEPRVVVSYRLSCTGRSVTTNAIAPDLAVINGAPTFLTLVEQARRPHDVTLELAPSWKASMTGLDLAPGGAPNHYRAPDFDTLVDSPIVAGDLAVNEFVVDGSRHYLVAAGDTSRWDGARVAMDLQKLVAEDRRLWGFLPFKKYVYLILLRGGGGGLEHLNSTLVNTGAATTTTERGLQSFLGLVNHEYFHAFNVKRLRPVELGPFDYENGPRTASLWISEGVTSYYGALAMVRAGVSTPDDFLAAISSQIEQLQKSPGRLVQTLEQSSADVWTNSMSGVNASSGTVSYYVKGEIAGFLLDAEIRRATRGGKSLDDDMRLAYKRFAGARGFTPEQFRQTASKVARTDLGPWFRKAIASTDELDYSPALDWYGLQFAAGADGAPTWRLEQRPDATAAQKSHLAALISSAFRR